MEQTQHKGYTVLTRKTMYRDGYVGMNKYAARDLKINYPYPENTIVVWEGLTPKERKLTIQHEIDEQNIMKREGLKYPQAHEKADRLERLGLKRRVGYRPPQPSTINPKQPRISSR